MARLMRIVPNGQVEAYPSERFKPFRKETEIPLAENGGATRELPLPDAGPSISGLSSEPGCILNLRRAFSNAKS